MSNIKIDLENTLINFNEMMVHSEVVEDINGELEEKAKDNTQFCGWIHLPTSIDKEEFGRIKNAAEKIQSDSDVLVVSQLLVRKDTKKSSTDCFKHHIYYIKISPWLNPHVFHTLSFVPLAVVSFGTINNNQ